MASCPHTPITSRTYRLVVLGSSRTGKTSILQRFIYNKFSEFYRPTIEDLHRKTFKIRGQQYQIDFVDTSGNNPFPMRQRYCLQTGDFFLIVCSVDSTASFDEVFRIRDQIFEVKQDAGYCLDRKNLRLPIVIAQNKLDLPQEQHVTDNCTARERSLNNPATLMIMCSAKTGENITEMFDLLFASATLPHGMSPGISRNMKLKLRRSKSSNSDDITLLFSDCSPEPDTKNKLPLLRLRSYHGRTSTPKSGEVCASPKKIGSGSLRRTIRFKRTTSAPVAECKPPEVKSINSISAKKKEKHCVLQ